MKREEVKQLEEEDRICRGEGTKHVMCLGQQFGRSRSIPYNAGIMIRRVAGKLG